MKILSQFLYLTSTVTAAVSSSSSFHPQTDKKIDVNNLQEIIDQNPTDWNSISPGLEFTRVDSNPKFNKAFDSAMQQYRFLPGEEDEDQENYYEDASNTGSGVHTQLSCLADPYEEYDEYQLAWRYLGFAIDCSYMGQYNDHQRERELFTDRKLPEEDDQGNACSRVLLYAVYVDTGYGGDGLDQYAFYNKTSAEWFGCDYQEDDDGNRRNLANNGGDRCVKMDCHVADSENWQLLGIFRNYLPNTWMEQLFKHEGVCVWGWDVYGNMSELREGVQPNTCTQVGNDSITGEAVYIGYQPLLGGNLGLALYSEERCYLDYTGSTMSVSSVCSNYEEEEDEHEHRSLHGGRNRHPCAFYDYMDYFNYGLDDWKICQPCTAYDPINQWDCYDDAGYTNCLQCMKFRNKAGSVPAGLEHIRLASKQSGITAIDICGTTYGSGGYGSNLGPVSLSDAMKANQQAVKIYKKLNKLNTEGNNKAEAGSYAYLGTSIMVVGAALVYAMDIDVKKKLLDSYSFVQAKIGKNKKDPLLSASDEGVMS